MKRLFSIIILCMLIPLTQFAQVSTVSLETTKTDIVGLWTGNLYNDSSQQFHKYEIVIQKNKGKYSGYSHTWFHFGAQEFYAVKKLKIRIAEDDIVVIYDDMLLRNDLPELPEKYSSQLNILSLQTTDSSDALTGVFVTNQTKKYLPLTGTVHLNRSDRLIESALVPFLQENEPAYIQTASNNAAQSKTENSNRSAMVVATKTD